MTAMAAFGLGITLGTWIGIIITACFVLASRADRSSSSNNNPPYEG